MSDGCSFNISKKRTMTFMSWRNTSQFRAIARRFVLYVLLRYVDEKTNCLRNVV